MAAPRDPLYSRYRKTEGTIDLETFNQILDLDEDETHDFSKDMVIAYFSQANTTFDEMDEA